MKAIDYINKNLLGLNPHILKQLLGNESVELTSDMWKYLSDTPWNTNKSILRSNWGLDLNSGENNEEWTTFRLERMELTVPDGEGGETTEYFLGSINSQDINKYKELCNLWQSNKHPIIKINGLLGSNEESTVLNNELATVNNFDGNFAIGSIINMGFCFIAYVDIEELGLEAKELLIASAAVTEEENNYIEISYKIGNYYTVTINIHDSNNIAYVSPNSLWTFNGFKSLEMDNVALTDGINIYHEGDTIQFTNDMTLEVTNGSEEIIPPVNPGNGDDGQQK